MDIRKKFFTGRDAKHWSRLPKEVVKLPSLGGIYLFIRHVDVALTGIALYRHKVELAALGSQLDLMILQIFLNLYDSMMLNVSYLK